MATSDQQAFRLTACVVSLALVLGWTLHAVVSHADRDVRSAPPRDMETTVPIRLGGYVSRPIAVSGGVVDGAAVSGYIFRAYDKLREPPTWLWVGYYETQRDATVHSPAGCYSGFGWVVADEAPRPANGGRPGLDWDVRWLRVRRETEGRLVLYWYETQYGAVGSELRRNLLRLRGRLGGSTELVFVRLSTPEDDTRSAQRRLMDLAELVRPHVRVRQ